MRVTAKMLGGKVLLLAGFMVAASTWFSGAGCGGGDGGATDAGGGGGADAGGGAAPTAQELLDAVNIPGAEKVGGALPAGSDDPAAPQVTGVTIPDSVGPGKLFQVTVSFRTGTAALSKLLVTIEGATGYFALAIQAIPNSDGLVSFPMMFEEEKLGSSAGGLRAALRGLGSMSKAVTGTSASLVVMLVDEEGNGGQPKKSGMQVDETAGACSGEGCGGAGGTDGGVVYVDAGEGRDASPPKGDTGGGSIDGGEERDASIIPPDGGGDAGGGGISCQSPGSPCVPPGGMEPTGRCYRNPDNPSAFVCGESCFEFGTPCGDTGDFCYFYGYGEQLGVLLCAPEGRNRPGDSCTAFNECAVEVDCYFGACVQACRTDFDCTDPSTCVDSSDPARQFKVCSSVDVEDGGTADGGSKGDAGASLDGGASHDGGSGVDCEYLSTQPGIVGVNAAIDALRNEFLSLTDCTTSGACQEYRSPGNVCYGIDSDADTTALNSLEMDLFQKFSALTSDEKTCVSVPAMLPCGQTYTCSGGTCVLQ